MLISCFERWIAELGKVVGPEGAKSVSSDIIGLKPGNLGLMKVQAQLIIRWNPAWTQATLIQGELDAYPAGRSSWPAEARKLR